MISIGGTYNVIRTAYSKDFMPDYDYCKKHDWSFLMPDLLICPWCARYHVMEGQVPEPVGDALIAYIRMLEQKITGNEYNTIEELQKALANGSPSTAT